jgi:hypothetical protein
MGSTLSSEFRHWRILTSKEALRGGPSVARIRLFDREEPEGLEVISTPALHLSVSTRSHRAVATTEWSNALLLGQLSEAREALAGVEDFPVVVTMGAFNSEALATREHTRSGKARACREFRCDPTSRPRTRNVERFSSGPPLRVLVSERPGGCEGLVSHRSRGHGIRNTGTRAGSGRSLLGWRLGVGSRNIGMALPTLCGNKVENCPKSPEPRILS